MSKSKLPLTAEKIFRLRVIFISVGLVLMLYALFFQVNFMPGRWMTYRNFDYEGEKNFINYMSPGINDLSTGTEYEFGHPHLVMLIIILFGFFPLMFFLRVVHDLDYKLKVRRFWTQWIGFVVARIGIFRVTGVCPVKRSSLGVFPFMNCQSCELATGACPLGTFQMALLNKQIPFLVIGQIILVGVLTGRTVCGWVCPYGFLSDIFNKLPGKRVRVKKVFNNIKYIYLAVFLVSAIAYFFRDKSTTLFYCSFLCPVGFYYGILEYGLTTGLPDVISQFPFIHILLAYHLGFALTIIIGSIKLGGRFFCKYACPLGTLYGLFSKISLLQVRLNNNRCTNCMACIQVCPMKIDVRDQRFKNKSDCINCGRCVKVCPTKKVEFSISLFGSKKNITGGTNEIEKKRIAVKGRR